MVVNYPTTVDTLLKAIHEAATRRTTGTGPNSTPGHHQEEEQDVFQWPSDFYNVSGEQDARGNPAYEVVRKAAVEILVGVPDHGLPSMGRLHQTLAQMHAV